MAEGQPSKGDIELVFKRLRAVPTNKVCFDCTAKNPTWSSVTYGVFICIDCSAVHRSLGVHLTFVRSTQLDTNWTWLQLRQMQLGGNANAESFFQQHNCNTKDAQQKYNSRAAQLYKEKLLTAATQAMRLHGTKILLKQNVRSLNHEETSLLYLDADNDLSQREDNKEIDFFEQHDNFDTDMEAPESSLNCHMAKLSADNADEKSGPSVNFSSSDNSERKPTIGNRKPQAKRPSGLGGKKGGLGAQRVKTNFADIEREAEMADKLKIQEKKPEVELTAEEEEAQITSMRLAYEDLSLKQKKEEEKMKAVDPLKAQQLERLGMGLGARSGISHSALSDMKTIEQENPSKPSKTVIDRDADDFFDDFGFVSNSSFTMYKSVPRNITSILGDGLDDLRSNKPTSFWDEPPDRKHSEKAVHVEKKPISPVNSTSNEAQMKFGTAKAISSDQFFSDSNDNSWERKTNLSRFEGSSSISSAEFFGRKEPTYNRGGLTPDLEDVKESVRQGVTKVAGKLSSLANGVMSSIQDKYGF